MDLNYPLTRYVYRPISMRVASRLAPTPITPSQITWFSTLLTLAAGTAFAWRLYLAGAVLALLGSVTDCVDGDLARMSGRTSRSGALLDSVLDRWADAALVLGLGFSDLERFGPIAALALVASFSTSYTRARAQSLGTDCPEGVATRDARMLILVVAALFEYVFAGLALVAALGLITSIQRMVGAMRSLGRLERQAPE